MTLQISPIELTVIGKWIDKESDPNKGLSKLVFEIDNFCECLFIRFDLDSDEKGFNPLERDNELTVMAELDVNEVIKLKNYLQAFIDNFEFNKKHETE